MRNATLFIALVPLLIIACVRGERDPVLGAASPGTPMTHLLPRGSEWSPAAFRFTLNPDTLATAVTPLPARTAAGFQASMFDLDLSRFQTLRQFEVTGTRLTSFGDVEVVFRHAHPWPAPNLALPPSAMNRADLSYTGRVLFLADVAASQVPNQTFFDGVIANTQTIRYADGYVRPGGVLAATGLTANTFPYMLLADDWKFSVSPRTTRITPTGENQSFGQYDTAIDEGGWQIANLGENRVAWEGYDFVHAGQTHENRFTIHGDLLEDGPLELDVALLLKYTEPKGSADKALRLPPATVDVSQFAYRMPHGALDCSKVVIDYHPTATPPDDIVHLPAEIGSVLHLACEIRDWDRGAVEVLDPDISLQNDISAVEFQARGLPTVDVHCPALSGTIASLSSTSATATGRGGDELTFEGTLTNATGTAPFAEHPALFRITDREAITQPPGSPHLGLDPETYVPDTALTLFPVTFQVLPVRLDPPAPVWQFVTVDDDDPRNGGDPSILLDDRGNADPSDDRICISYTGDDVSLRFAQAPVDGFEIEANWTSHFVVDNATYDGLDSELLIWQGRPAIVRIAGAGARWWPQLAQATTANPLASTDWTDSFIQPIPPTVTDTVYGIDAVVTPANDLLVAYIESGESLNIGRSLSLSPTGPVDWAVYTLDESKSGQGGVLSLIQLPGNGHALAYPGPLDAPSSWPYGLKLAITELGSPVSKDDWIIERALPDGAFVPKLVDLFIREDILNYICSVAGDSGRNFQYPGSVLWGSRSLDVAASDPWKLRQLRYSWEDPIGGGLVPVLVEDRLHVLISYNLPNSEKNLTELVDFNQRQTEPRDWMANPVETVPDMIPTAPGWEYELDGLLVHDQLLTAFMSSNQHLTLAYRTVLP